MDNAFKWFLMYMAVAFSIWFFVAFMDKASKQDDKKACEKMGGVYYKYNCVKDDIIIGE